MIENLPNKPENKENKTEIDNDIYFKTCQEICQKKWPGDEKKIEILKEAIGMKNKIYENPNKAPDVIYNEIQEELKEFAKNFPSNDPDDLYGEMRKYLLFHILIGSTPMLESIEFFDAKEKGKQTIYDFIKKIYNTYEGSKKDS